ncbi:MAG: radical SAM protein [Patescibacteria group bacterium]
MLRLPAYAQLEMTDICNLRCKHCYLFNTDEMPKSSDLTDGNLDELVQKIVDAKVYSLVITGGEPLVRSTATLRALSKATEAGITTSINTNLLLLTPALISELKRLKVGSLLVSCPASNREVYRQMTRGGDYRRFESCLKLLLEADISCLINMVVTKTNFHLIRDTATDMARLGVKRLSVTPASLNVGHPDYEGLLDKSQILNLLEDLKWCDEELGLKVDMVEPLPKCFYPDWCWKKNYAFMGRACQAGRMSVSISNTGNVRPCSHNPLIYGNLFHESLESIWNKMGMYRSDVIPNDCKNCPTVSSCNGACRTNALATTGSLAEPDRLMIGHINPPKKERKKINIEDHSFISFKGKLRWREETNGCYSMTSKLNNSNLTVVNGELFRFICWLEKSLPLIVSEVMAKCANGSTKESFYRILETVARKEFINIT